MIFQEITLQDTKTQLKKLKPGKAPGPDCIKSELYKYLVDDHDLIMLLTKIMNNILHEGTIPTEWRTSRTVLVLTI